MSMVYLDNNATTPVDPRALDAMMPYLRDKFGNAASRSHSLGWEAGEAVTAAREQLGQAIGASPKEIIWTSGATESDNIAVKGTAQMYRDKGNHIIIQATEHKAVIDPAKYLEQHGFEVTVLGVDRHGLINLAELEEAITDRTTLVSIMLANNETGTIQPVAEIGRLCKKRGVVFHSDGAQALGKVPIDVNEMGVDLLSMSGHKIYGPKGIGALYVRRKNPRVRCEPVLHGGGHERGMRSGTLNVPAIVGFGAAVNIALEGMAAESKRIIHLRDRLEQGLKDNLEDIVLNGHPERRLPNTLNMSFRYVEGESLMMAFKDIAVSSGSACTSASLEPSYVLLAQGVGDDLAHSSIRFTLGRFTTEDDIEHTIKRVTRGVNHLRLMSPLYEMAKEGVDLDKVEWSH